MATINVYLQQQERNLLENVASSTLVALELHNATKDAVDHGYRLSELVFVTEGSKVSCACLDIPLPSKKSELFRLCVNQGVFNPDANAIIRKTSRSGGTSLVEDHPFYLGDHPSFFLISREDEIPAGAIFSEPSIKAICVDALLLAGNGRRALITVDVLPTWISLTTDQNAIDEVLSEARKIELLTGISSVRPSQKR